MPGVHQKFREKIGALLVSYDSAQQQLIVVVSHSKLGCVRNSLKLTNNAIVLHCTMHTILIKCDPIINFTLG